MLSESASDDSRRVPVGNKDAKVRGILDENCAEGREYSKLELDSTERRILAWWADNTRHNRSNKRRPRRWLLVGTLETSPSAVLDAMWARAIWSTSIALRTMRLSPSPARAIARTWGWAAAFQTWSAALRQTVPWSIRPGARLLARVLHFFQERRQCALP